MNKAVFALLTRSLMLDSKRIATYIIRFLVVIGFCLFLSALGIRQVGAPGLQFFISIAYINTVIITIAGISYFSSAISEEKEENTLGLLRMTDLSSVSILLGKSTTRVIGALLLLVIQIPFIMLSITLGGVTVMQIISAYISLAAYTIFVSSLALVCSVICKTSRGAGSLTFLFLSIFFFIPFLFDLVFIILGTPVLSGAGFSNSINSIRTLLAQTSPYYQLELIMATGFKGSIINVQVISNIIFGIILFLLAWKIFNFVTRQEIDVSPGRGLVAKRTSRLPFLSPGRAWQSLPLCWKEFYFHSGGWLVLIIKFILICGVFTLILTLSDCNLKQSCDREKFGVLVMFMMSFAAFIEMLFRTGRMFGNEIKEKTLPSLVMLPMSIQKIAFQKILAGILTFIPSLFFFCVGVFFYPKGFGLAVEALFKKGVIFISVTGLCVSLYMVVYASLMARERVGCFGSFTFLSIFFGNAFLIGLFGEASLVLMPILWIVLCIILHKAIIRKLNQLACE
ncbi:MAG: hypothetical protein ABIH42_01740 [Planctomycetota bacterium]